MPDGTQLTAYASADIEGRFAAVGNGPGTIMVEVYSPDTFIQPGRFADLFMDAAQAAVPGGFTPATATLTWQEPLLVVWYARTPAAGREAGWRGTATISIT